MVLIFAESVMSLFHESHFTWDLSYRLISCKFRDFFSLVFIFRQLRYQRTLLDFVPRLLGAVCVKLILQPQLLIMQCTQTGLKAAVQPTII